MIYLNKLTFRVDSSNNDVDSVRRKASFDSLDKREVAHPLGLWQAQESRQAAGFRVSIFKQHGAHSARVSSGTNIVPHGTRSNGHGAARRDPNRCSVN